jgi:hypothetical protein
VNITATLGQNRSTAVINLIKAPNPYMIDGTTSWLSVDLRVFQMRQGQVKSTVAQGASGNVFIGSLLDRFNALPDNDYHPFRALTIDQNDSKLELSETVGGATVFNYAVAKVRYKAPIPTLPPADANDAKDVKVFFRSFNTAGTAMQFNPASTYRIAGTGANTIALIGKEGNAISSIPFFAAPRVNSSVASMGTQTDDKNRRTLRPGNNIESVAYFGCWLDINRDGNKLFPLNPTTDGPFSGSRKSILELIRGVHQCLVAQIYFEGDPTPINATPGSSDNLAQRNLAIVQSDNPGNPATHTVQHTFEIKPSPFHFAHELMEVAEQPNRFAAAVLDVAVKQRTRPDYLLIHWNNLPRDSKVTLFMPDVAIDDILALESILRASPSRIIKDDEHTCSFLAADVNHIPVPGGFDGNIPGLMTIELPSTVTKGQLFKVLVQQTRYLRDSQRVVGSFQVNIPVTTADLMLPEEMRNLAVLKHIHQAIPSGSGWDLIFNRYLKGLSDKVDGLGGDASNVPPSPDDRWMGDGDQPGSPPTIPNNLSEFTGDLNDVIQCVSRHSEHIGCIRVKGVTLDIRFKDKDCC